MKRTVLSALALMLAACGAGETPEPETGDGALATTGGETETEVVAEDEHPMRTTVPVPVPQPAVAREELSEALQATWTGIEEVVAIRPPAGPAEATEEAIEAWAEGPLTEWIVRRRDATRAVGTVAADVPDEPVWERAVGAALFAYALEDFAADIRSSPVPVEVTQDPELLQLYVDALTESLRPVAIESVINYAVCQQRLAPLGDESEWLPWRAYCVQRGQEMIQVYQLQPHEMQPAEVVDEEPAGAPATADEPGEV